MDTALNRLSAMTGFFVMVLALGMSAIAIVSSYLRVEREPDVSISIDRISNRLGVEDYLMNRKVMLTDVVLSLDADFDPLFHWNVKQLFIYLTLEYESPNYIRNEIVFWDKIMDAKDSHRLSLSNLRSKYSITDIEDQLPGTDAFVKLHWQLISHVGVLGGGSKGSIPVRIPSV